jgi:hypothetical protein
MSPISRSECQEGNETESRKGALKVDYNIKLTLRNNFIISGLNDKTDGDEFWCIWNKITIYNFVL